jgi:DNA mismatch endonuclease (patch repair protein)
MADVHTKEQRSRNMAAIKGKNTKPELRVRSLLHSLGFRYRLHSGDLPGRPDLVLPRFHTAIFVNGCFWHSHSCRYGQVRPASQSTFWEQKRTETVLRDQRKIQALLDQSWHVMVIWECETKTVESLTAALEPLIGKTGRKSIAARA